MNRSDAIRCVLREKGRDVFSIPPHTSVYDAVAVMADKQIGALLVKDSDQIVGVISERDYARKVILQGRSSRDTEVAEIMTDEVLTVSPGDTVDHAMKLMTANRVRHLPVVDEADVVGVVSMGDLVKYVITAQREEIEHLHAYISGTY